MVYQPGRATPVGDVFNIMPSRSSGELKPISTYTHAVGEVHRLNGLDTHLLDRTGNHMYVTAQNVPTRNVRRDVATGIGLTVDITADVNGTIMKLFVIPPKRSSTGGSRHGIIAGNRLVK